MTNIFDDISVLLCHTVMLFLTNKNKKKQY